MMIENQTLLEDLNPLSGENEDAPSSAETPDDVSASGVQPALDMAEAPEEIEEATAKEEVEEKQAFINVTTGQFKLVVEGSEDFVRDILKKAPFSFLLEPQKKNAARSGAALAPHSSANTTSWVEMRRKVKKKQDVAILAIYYVEYLHGNPSSKMDIKKFLQENGEDITYNSLTTYLSRGKQRGWVEYSKDEDKWSMLKDGIEMVEEWLKKKN